MPEAPEVRRYADELHKHLAGRTIRSVQARTKAAKAWLAEHNEELNGRSIVRVWAYGKNIIGEISGDYFFYSHQMMWGRWQIFEGDTPVVGDRRERARIVVDGATALLNSAPVFELGRGDAFKVIQYLRNLGPLALTERVEEFDHDEFIRRLDSEENAERTIGDALLDQTIVCGLGNYLRAEIMFLAHLDPWTLVSQLTLIDRANLKVLIPSVTNQAYALDGVTVTPQMRARMAGDASLVYVPGKEYGTRHYVFRRTNLPCLICGKPVRQLRQEQTHQRVLDVAPLPVANTSAEDDEELKTRIVYFCANCQGVKLTVLESKSKTKKRLTVKPAGAEPEVGVKPKTDVKSKTAAKTKAGVKTQAATKTRAAAKTNAATKNTTTLKSPRVTKTKVRDTVLELLHERGEGKTICPSEAARKLDSEGWRELMDLVRKVADEMQTKKLIKVTQKGKKIASAVKAVGPIRLKLS